MAFLNSDPGPNTRTQAHHKASPCLARCRGACIPFVTAKATLRISPRDRLRSNSVRPADLLLQLGNFARMLQRHRRDRMRHCADLASPTSGQAPFCGTGVRRPAAAIQVLSKVHQEHHKVHLQFHQIYHTEEDHGGHPMQLSASICPSGRSMHVRTMTSSPFHTEEGLPMQMTDTQHPS
jgi:hypothetical protein